jgi:hypothetical protein
MLKTLLAGTALASALALGVQAQQAPSEPETTPPAAVENKLPSTTSAEPAAPMVPETADDAGAAPAPDATAPDTMAQEPAGGAPALQEGWTAVDLPTISADALIGTDIRTYDQDTVASVEDALMTPDGKVESVVARFGGFLGFGETTVLLAMDEITVVKDPDENVFVLTNLTPEALKERPQYTPPEG